MKVLIEFNRLKGMIHLHTLEIILTIVQLISCLAITVIVLFQSGKSAGLSGAFGGNSESFMAKNKAKALDAKLARMTKWVAIVFAVLTLALNFVIQ